MNLVNKTSTITVAVVAALVALATATHLSEVAATEGGVMRGLSVAGFLALPLAHA